MTIRAKVILIVLPLIIVPLVFTGAAAFFAARNAVTSIATRFLRFKAEELSKYADSQWTLLEENQLAEREDFVEIARLATESFARSLVRTDTERVFGMNQQAEVTVQSSNVPFTESERRTLLDQLAAGAEWVRFTAGGEPHVGQAAYFEPFEWYFVVSERESVFYQAVERIFLLTGVILGASSVVSVVALFALTYYITNPLRVITHAMRGIISEGDLSGRVPVLYADETGELSHTFNLMTSELERAYDRIKGYALRAAIAQKKETKIRNIFQKYVPNDVIERIFHSPESMLVGENRVLAVLFSDIRKFTSISEQMKPEEIVESLNAYFARMVDVIMERDGIVDKYIGDAIMAFFGAPVSHDDDAVRAVRAGLAMLDGLAVFNEEERAKGRAGFAIGVAINYGPVTVGNIGSERKMDYTVIGDMVNVASRLESLTKYYSEPILISESVFDSIDGQIPCRLVDKVAVQGRSAGIRVYAPRSSLSESEREAWRLHDQALDLYYRRRFTDAAEIFREVWSRLDNDRLAALYVRRCRAFAESPPEPEWNGVTVMRSK
jgi:class 3 adenylate cyclase/HAMP domain-containing protein